MKAVSEELDKILDKEFKVLDKGFVRAVDYMGNDFSIVQAARVSYGAGTKKVSEDRGLIRYLLRNKHTSPFEMCELQLHIKCPIYVWRQWIRHRTANVNELSGRYSVMTDEKHETGPREWRLQSQNNKQGSDGLLHPNFGRALSNKEHEFHDTAQQVYQERLDQDIAREQARKDLPLSTYTEAYWKIDLHNLLHFLALRMDTHAQLEIREYANIIGNEIVAKWCPIVWEAFKDYRLNSLNLSSHDIKFIKKLCSGELIVNDEEFFEGLGKREIQEFKSKANRLGLL